MLAETAIDTGNLHALIEAVQVERDAEREEAGGKGYRPVLTTTGSPAGNWSHFPQ